MLKSSAFKSISAGSFLALAIAAYVASSPVEGLLSGPNTVSALLHSLPVLGF